MICKVVLSVLVGPLRELGEGGGRGNFSFFLLKIGNRKQDPSFVIWLFSTVKFFLLSRPSANILGEGEGLFSCHQN